MTTAETLCGPFTVAPGDVLLYLDHRALDRPQVDGDIAFAETRWELRRVYETQVRRRDDAQPGLFVHITCPDLVEGRDLPVDVAQLPWVTLDRSVGPLHSADLATLPWAARRALTASGDWSARLDAAARELTAQAWPPDEADSLPTVLRLLIAAPDASQALRAQWSVRFPAGPGRDLLLADNPFAGLQELWDRAPDADWVSDAQDLLASLVAAGSLTAHTSPERLAPASAPPELSWPDVPPAHDLDGWRDIAALVADRRRAVATSSHPDPAALDAAFRSWWRPVDNAWVDWLTMNYAALLSRGPLHPTAVHKIPAFLSRTVVSHGHRFVLLVLDGLGLSQWSALRDWHNLDPLEEHMVMAGLPTITSVSRQSIFSGQLPVRFQESLTTTAKESTRWTDFWIREGQLDPGQSAFLKTQGANAADWIAPDPKAIAIGIAAVAIDDLMHGSSVNGDRQLFAGLRTWSQQGYLDTAINWARRAETQLWVTSDHGNLAAYGLDRAIPNAGVVATKGKRVRIFDSTAVRDQCALGGLAWRPPGYPEEAGAPLFAEGDSAFQRGGVTVSHGGLSLDEVLVPLARLV